MPYLLDSLYRGYPVGALIGKTQLDVPLRAADVLQGEHTYERALLLDGWQRPTSLAKVMKPEVVKGPVLDVRFDLRTETFLNPSAVQRKDALLIKVSDVLQESPQFASMLLAIGLSYESPDFDEYYRRLQKVYSIRKYPMPILTVESDDCEEVAEIFARVKQGGRRLSKGDLVYSAIAARWPEGLDTIEAFRDELDKVNFALDREAVLRLTGLLAGVDAQSIKLIGQKVTGDDLKTAWGRTEDALRRAVDFLTSECSIPRAAAVTSPNVAVIPAYFLHQRKGRDDPRRGSWPPSVGVHGDGVQPFLEPGRDQPRHRCADHRPWRPGTLRRAGPPSCWAAVRCQRFGARGPGAPLGQLAALHPALHRCAARWCEGLALERSAYCPANEPDEQDRVLSRVPEGEGAASLRPGALPTVSPTLRSFPAPRTRRSVPRIRTSTCRRSIRNDWSSSGCRVQTWHLDDFETFLALRRQAQTAALNDLLGLPPYVAGQPRGDEGELPVDDDKVTADEED